LIALGRYGLVGTVGRILVVSGGLTFALTHLLNLKFLADCSAKTHCINEDHY
jgi:hypothetical protein